MKKVLSLILVMAILLAIQVTPIFSKDTTAISTSSVSSNSVSPTSSNVLVNGKAISFEAYNIKGSNYFKLRDLAMAINGTEKQFEVTWDSTKNAISLTKNKAYTSTGGELAVSANPTATEAKPTTSKVYVNGNEVSLTAYNINESNYFKLRDIAKEIDFGVTWDGKANIISIDTSNVYMNPIPDNAQKELKQIAQNAEIASHADFFQSSMYYYKNLTSLQAGNTSIRLVCADLNDNEIENHWLSIEDEKDKAVMEAVKIIIAAYYPKSYEAVYAKIQQTINTKEKQSNLSFDGRTFSCDFIKGQKIYFILIGKRIQK